MSELKGEIIELSTVLDHWTLVEAAIREKNWGEKKIEDCGPGPFYGLSTTLRALVALWFLDFNPWPQLRTKVSIGLIKETAEYGNTSVSMGAAACYPLLPAIGFLNCGTGGIKYQLYTRDVTNILKLESEFKPKNGLSVNSLLAGNYRPKPGEEITMAVLEQSIRDELKDAPWKDRPDIPVVAFVTGQIRQYWEIAGEGEKKVLDSQMEALFQPFKISKLVKQSSYFMPQDTEGKLELLATQTLYKNLVKAGLLDQDVEVIGSIGIGRGSLQWMIGKEGEAVSQILYQEGMKDPERLVDFPDVLKAQYEISAKREALVTSVRKTAKPVIALKSGSVLLFSKYEQYKRILQTKVPPLPGDINFNVKVERGTKRLRTRAATLDRLYAEASALLKTEVGCVYRNNEHDPVANFNDLQPKDTLTFYPANGAPVTIHAAPASGSSLLGGILTYASGLMKYFEKDKEDRKVLKPTPLPKPEPEEEASIPTCGPSPRLAPLDVTSTPQKLPRPHPGSPEAVLLAVPRPSTPCTTGAQLEVVRKGGIVSPDSITDVSKPTEFWIRNDEEREVEVEIRLLPVDQDEEGKDYFTILPPCECRFRKSTNQNSRNTFKISYTPPKQTERNAVVEVCFKRSNEAVKVRQFRVYGNVKWIQKISETKKASEKENTSFPLRNILDRWHLAVESLINPASGERVGENVESINGLHSILSALKDIYLMNIAGWREIRDRVQIGLLKETKDCGNTSVSMGLATVFFTRNPSRNYVAFVNCGTGGAKYQLYYRLKQSPTEEKKKTDPNLCTAVAEAKPQNGAVSQVCPVGDYRPSGDLKRQTLGEVRAEIVRGLKHAPWALDFGFNKEYPDTAELTSKEFVPFAFVTGSIRNHWSKATDEMKSIMDEELQVLFPGCQTVSSLLQDASTDQSDESEKQPSYFLTQEDEGYFEALAVRAMYKAGWQLNKPPPGTKKSSVVVVIGFGSGSSQLSIFKKVRKGNKHDTKTVVIPYKYGMRNPAGLRNFGQYVVSHPAMEDLVAVLTHALSKGHVPMIALKSGTVIRLWDAAPLRAALCSSTASADYTMLAPNGMSWTNPVDGTWSVPRLCADAQLKAGDKQDYVLAYLNGDRAPTSLKLTPNDTLKFEHFPEFVWWWPGKCKQVESKQPAKSSEESKQKEEAKKTEEVQQCEIDITAQLLIHIPFDLMKDFLERKDDTIQTRFKQLLLDFFGHDSPKSPTSYECIAKVYRLLHDIYSKHEEDLKYDFYDIAAAFATQAPDYDEEQRNAFRELPKDLLSVPATKFGKENEERQWLKILNKSEFVIQDRDAQDFNVLRRRAVVHYTEFARKLDAVAMRLSSEFTDAHAKHNVKSVESIKRKLELRKGDFTFRHILDYLRGTIFVGTANYRGADTVALKDQVSRILDAIESSVGEICRIKLDGCKKKLFFIVSVKFKNLVAEVQIRLPAKKNQNAPSDDHIRWEVERTFGECVSSSMDLATACLDFFAVPCGFTFQRFDHTQRVTLRCVNNKCDVQQSEIALLETTQLTFFQKWSKELERYPVFLRGTQDVTRADQSRDGVNYVWAPPYIDAKDKEDFVRGVRVGFDIVWKAIRLRQDFVVEGSPYVNENKVTEFLSRELSVARANARKGSERKDIWKTEEDEGDDDSAQAAFYEMKSPTVAELASRVTKSPSAFLRGIMISCRFCRKNRIGLMLKNEEFLKTFGDESLRISLHDKTLIFGVLASLCAVGDIAHEAWLTYSTTESSSSSSAVTGPAAPFTELPYLFVRKLGFLSDPVAAEREADRKSVV